MEQKSIITLYFFKSLSWKKEIQWVRFSFKGYVVWFLFMENIEILMFKTDLKAKNQEFKKTQDEYM